MEGDVSSDLELVVLRHSNTKLSDEIQGFIERWRCHSWSLHCCISCGVSLDGWVPQVFVVVDSDHFTGGLIAAICQKCQDKSDNEIALSVKLPGYEVRPRA